MVKPVPAKKTSLSPAESLAARAGVDHLFFLTDCTRVTDPVSVCRRLPVGSTVILRDYDHADRPSLAAALRAETALRKQHFLVAGDERLARKAGADGLHLPEHQLMRLKRKPDFPMVTAACHNRQAIAWAGRLGLTAALVSPVFPTRSHEGAEALGIHRFARLIVRPPLPIVALGGISMANAAQLKPLDLFGIAGIGCFAD